MSEALGNVRAVPPVTVPGKYLKSNADFGIEWGDLGGSGGPVDFPGGVSASYFQAPVFWNPDMTQSRWKGYLFGASQDSSIWRLGAGMLATDAAFTSTGRFYTGGPGTGGMWVDGGAAQFVGSQDANYIALYNGGWNLALGSDGKTYFGTPKDANLYRDPSGAILATDTSFWVKNNHTVSNSIFMLGPTSKILWSSGSGFDTNLYRNGVAWLRTNSNLQVDGNMSTGTGVYFGGWGSDAYLYRSAAYTLKISGGFHSEGALGGWGFFTSASGDTSPRAFLRNDAQLWFGPGNAGVDTVLYRAGAGDLRAGGVFRATQLHVFTAGDSYPHLVIAPDGSLTWASEATGQDVNLYRGGANVLKTDDSFYIANGQNLVLDNGLGSGLQIEMGWSGRNYRHTMKTFHNGSTGPGNSIDFNVWRPSDAIGALAATLSLRVGVPSSSSGWSGVALNVSGVGVREIACGPADSGGSGFRQLIIPN